MERGRKLAPSKVKDIILLAMEGSRGKSSKLSFFGYKTLTAGAEGHRRSKQDEAHLREPEDLCSTAKHSRTIQLPSNIAEKEGGQAEEGLIRSYRNTDPRDLAPGCPELFFSKQIS